MQLSRVARRWPGGTETLVARESNMLSWHHVVLTLVQQLAAPSGRFSSWRSNALYFWVLASGF